MSKDKKLFLVYSIYFIVLVVFVAFRILAGYGVLAGIENDYVHETISTGIIQFFIMFALPLALYFLFFKQKPKEAFKNLGFKKISFKIVLISIGIGICAFVLNLFVANFFSVILEMFGYAPESFGSSGGGLTYTTIPSFLFGILTVAIMPALFEEFLHRGVLLKSTAKTMGYKWAIIFSSLCFGLMHLNVEQFFYATILGILMGLIASMSDSIWPAVIVHFCNNFINIYLVFAEANSLPLGDIFSTLSLVASHSFLLWIMLSIGILVLCVFLLLKLIKKLFVETKAKSLTKSFDKIEQEIRASSPEKEMSDQDVLIAFEKIVLPNIKTPKNTLETLLPTTETDNYKPAFWAKIPLYACLFLSGIVTLFTYIWGVF